MPFLVFLARAFIGTFGITEPTPENERKAARFIGLLIALIAAGVLVMVYLFVDMRK